MSQCVGSLLLSCHCVRLQDDDIPGIVRYHTYEVLKQEINNPAIRWAYLPYSMHMAGPREAVQHMIIRKNYGEAGTLPSSPGGLGRFERNLGVLVRWRPSRW